MSVLLSVGYPRDGPPLFNCWERHSILHLAMSLLLDPPSVFPRLLLPLVSSCCFSPVYVHVLGSRSGGLVCGWACVVFCKITFRISCGRVNSTANLYSRQRPFEVSRSPALAVQRGLAISVTIVLCVHRLLGQKLYVVGGFCLI